MKIPYPYHILLFVTSAIWGAAFFNFSIAIQTIPPFSLTFLRCLIAYIAFYFMFYKTPVSPSKISVPYSCLIGAMQVFLPYTCLGFASIHNPSSINGLVMSSGIILAPILSYVFLKNEKISVRSVFGIIVGCLGLLMLNFHAFHLHSISHLPSTVLAFFAIVFYSIANLLFSKNNSDVRAFSINSVKYGVLLSFPFGVIETIHYGIHYSKSALLSVFFLGVFPTAIGIYCKSILLKRKGMTFTSQIAILIPLFAVLFGVTIMGEKLTNATLLGGLLIVFSIFILKNQKLLKNAD